MVVEVRPQLIERSLDDARQLARVVGRIAQIRQLVFASVSDFLQAVVRLFTAGRFGLPIQRAEIILNLVTRDRPQPTTKAVARLAVPQLRNSGHDAAKDFLRGVAGIGRLQPRSATPLVNHRPIEFRKSSPGILVMFPHAAKQTR